MHKIAAKPSSGGSAPSKTGSTTIAASPKGDSSSINNTMSKARNNADLQKLEVDSHDFRPDVTPQRNMALKNIKQTSRMSHLTDRRLLDKPISGISVGSMKL